MKVLEDRILAEGIALSDTVLKVDSFLNHQVDPALMSEIGKTFAGYFRDRNITKVFTVESSGIAPSIYTAQALSVPLVVLKKQTSKIMTGELYQTNITSFTKGTSYELSLSRNYISENDNILIVDDFLANGEAASGASRLAVMGGAAVAGIGIVIEKSFQNGRSRLESEGYQVVSLARISRLRKGKIELTQADL